MMARLKTSTHGSWSSDVGWRRDVLREAGLERREARAIASQPTIDVHGIVSLVERGCPVHLALRIMAVEEEDA